MDGLSSKNVPKNAVRNLEDGLCRRSYLVSLLSLLLVATMEAAKTHRQLLLVFSMDNLGVVCVCLEET